MSKSLKYLPMETTQIASRCANLEDFFSIDDTNIKNKYNKINLHDDNIAKNQQEFGHKKRIKP